MINARFKFFVDRNAVRSRVESKKLKVLSRVGAFGKKVMKNKYRKPLSQTKNRQVNVNGNDYLVQLRGLVIDATTGRPARTAEAQAARIELAKQFKAKGAGKPPRRGPTDKLYKFTDFGVDPQTESAVIGAYPFPKQPRLVGRVSVPELLDKGGGEWIAGQLVQYDQYPFTIPSLEPTARKMAELVESVPL